MTMDDFRSLVNMRPTPPTGRSVLPGESALDIVSGDTLWLPGNELVVDFGIAESADALSKMPEDQVSSATNRYICPTGNIPD